MTGPVLVSVTKPESELHGLIGLTIPECDWELTQIGIQSFDGLFDTCSIDSTQTVKVVPLHSE